MQRPMPRAERPPVIALRLEGSLPPQTTVCAGSPSPGDGLLLVLSFDELGGGPARAGRNLRCIVL